MTPFTKPITEIIRQRYSCRSYINKPIDSEVRSNLSQFAASLGESSNGLQARFELAAAREADLRALRQLGTYGFIHGASGFLIGGTSDGEAHLEVFGMLMEKWVLLATDLGLGTCWLGGTFTKSSFARKFQAGKGELIPAVIATGYPAPRRRAIEQVIRRGAVADRRFGWSRLFFNDSFGEPLSRDEAGDYAEALEMVRLGPSASNKQPWRIVRQGDRWHFYLQRTPGYREGLLNRMFTQADLQRIDMGIAMCHFELTASEDGLKGEWLHEEPGLEKPDELSEYSMSWLEKSA
jgi:nitroreductase